ncbi:hypothetical protein CCYN49044_520002 [Capnocytophaga cynodegmi]|nr:hypothetical protein CCYN49044_520002 [Capnocytophaga cynodegmi]
MKDIEYFLHFDFVTTKGFDPAQPDITFTIRNKVETLVIIKIN